MPVHKVIKNGKTGYQWGTTGKAYFGTDAKKQADDQASAIRASQAAAKKKKK
jgi:hypothetical protein